MVSSPISFPLDTYCLFIPVWRPVEYFVFTATQMMDDNVSRENITNRQISFPVEHYSSDHSSSRHHITPDTFSSIYSGKEKPIAINQRERPLRRGLTIWPGRVGMKGNLSFCIPAVDGTATCGTNKEPDRRRDEHRHQPGDETTPLC